MTNNRPRWGWAGIAALACLLSMPAVAADDHDDHPRLVMEQLVVDRRPQLVLIVLDPTLEIERCEPRMQRHGFLPVVRRGRHFPT